MNFMEIDFYEFDDNEACAYLKEAENCFSKIVEIDPYRAIYEAENADVKNAETSNGANQAKGTSAVHKAIAAIKRMVQAIIEKIRNFIDKLGMSGEEKDAYERFKEACAQDPSLKGKKITVQDYKKIMAQYDELIAEAERKCLEVKRNEKTTITDVLGKIGNFIKGAGANVATAVAADTLVKSSADSKAIAKAVKASMELQPGILDGLEKQLGAAEAKRIQKDVNSCTKLVSLRRGIIRLYAGKADTIQERVTKEKEEIGKILHGNVKAGIKNSRLIKNTFHGDETKAVAKTAGKVAVVAGKTAGTVGKAAAGQLKDEAYDAASKKIYDKTNGKIDMGHRQSAANDRKEAIHYIGMDKEQRAARKQNKIAKKAAKAAEKAAKKNA